MGENAIVRKVFCILCVGKWWEIHEKMVGTIICLCRAENLLQNKCISKSFFLESIVISLIKFKKLQIPFFTFLSGTVLSMRQIKRTLSILCKILYQ